MQRRYTPREFSIFPRETNKPLISALGKSSPLGCFWYVYDRRM